MHQQRHLIQHNRNPTVRKRDNMPHTLTKVRKGIPQPTPLQVPQSQRHTLTKGHLHPLTNTLQQRRQAKQGPNLLSTHCPILPTENKTIRSHPQALINAIQRNRQHNIIQTRTLDSKLVRPNLLIKGATSSPRDDRD